MPVKVNDDTLVPVEIGVRLIEAGLLHCPSILGLHSKFKLTLLQRDAVGFFFSFLYT